MLLARVFDCDISQQVFPEGKISTKPKLVTNTLVHVVQYEYCYVVDLEWSVIEKFGWNYIIRHTTTPITSMAYSAAEMRQDGSKYIANHHTNYQRHSKIVGMLLVWCSSNESFAYVRKFCILISSRSNPLSPRLSMCKALIIFCSTD